jgi:hypothetical protein
LAFYLMEERANVATKDKDRLRASSAWQLEFVRLIGFPVRPWIVPDADWWKDVAGACPGDFVSTRKKDYRDDRGSFQAALLSLTVSMNRVIWEARPPAEVDESGNFPTFTDPFEGRFAWFIELLLPWLRTSCPPLLRLAFSAKLLHAAASADEAYRVLASKLPIVHLESKPNDFLLQINRRKKNSTVVKRLPINRVSTWSKMNVAIFVEPGQPFQWPDRCYAALELDINTATENAEGLPPKVLPPLFEELKSLGVDIVEHGDHP